ncbi:hypothetical protein SERLA73DRAFT_47914 [Serpula lacrymans var. lacrymans S7.3]|uniref:Uncharacterized protein n=1 Tax=Serpula lacrymans var. lacrymans (strain S7.3) TaxID=936435 RepID=F8PNE6_SERL3|nr:hypothetical protein SERLA73DRAFT_47914 [Serpula lacrymans var. lacrymans S7.3]
MASISSPSTGASRLTRESYEPDNKINLPAQQNQFPSPVPITTTTNVSSPGRELPGAFPRELEAGSTVNASRNIGNGGSNELCVPIAGTVIHTAKLYMPNQVERVVKRTGQTAAHYLPIPRGVQDTVSAYWIPNNEASLPSSETRGTQPSQPQSGVGELPGTAGEAGVAVLPDERKEIQANGGATAKGNDTPPSLPSSESPDTSDPKTFTTHTGGVGALPGGRDEVGVAVLPDQRQGNDVGNDGRGFRQNVGFIAIYVLISGHVPLHGTFAVLMTYSSTKLYTLPLLTSLSIYHDFVSTI